MYTRGRTYKKGHKSYYGHDVGTTSTKIYDARQKRTDYACTLIDPELRLGVRIPDLACYQTATFTTEYHQPLSIDNSTGTTNNCLFTVMTGAGCPTVWFHQGSHGTVPGDLTTGAGGEIVIGDTQANYQAKYKSCRLVSASVRISYAGNDTTTEGTIMGTFLPSDWNLLVPAAPNNIAYYTPQQWKDLPDYYSGPLRNGVVIRYKPHDALSFDMQATSQNLGAYSAFGGMMVSVQLPNATASVTLQLDIVMNWEALLASTATGIPQGISGADPGALAHGLNAAAASDSAFAGTASAWAKNVDALLRQVA